MLRYLGKLGAGELGRSSGPAVACRFRAIPESKAATSETAGLPRVEREPEIERALQLLLLEDLGIYRLPGVLGVDNMLVDLVLPGRFSGCGTIGRFVIPDVKLA